jgi:hypothetical protein
MALRGLRHQPRPPPTPEESPQQVTAWLDSRHRVHARVEAHFKDGNTTGAKRLPSKKFAVNAAWYRTQAIATDLIAWLQLLACHGHLARAEPRTLQYQVFHTPRHPHPRRPTTVAELPTQLALHYPHPDDLPTTPRAPNPNLNPPPAKGENEQHPPRGERRPPRRHPAPPACHQPETTPLNNQPSTPINASKIVKRRGIRAMLVVGARHRRPTRPQRANHPRLPERAQDARNPSPTAKPAHRPPRRLLPPALRRGPSRAAQHPVHRGHRTRLQAKPLDVLPGADRAPAGAARPAATPCPAVPCGSSVGACGAPGGILGCLLIHVVRPPSLSACLPVADGATGRLRRRQAIMNRPPSIPIAWPLM